MVPGGPLRYFCRKPKMEITVIFPSKLHHVRSVQLPVALQHFYFQAAGSLPPRLYPALSPSYSEVERVPGAGPAHWVKTEQLTICPVSQLDPPPGRVCDCQWLLLCSLWAVCVLRVKNWLVSHATSRSHLLRHPSSRCPSSALQAMRLALSP